MRTLLFLSLFGLQCAIPKSIEFPSIDCEDGCAESAPTSAPLVSYPNPTDEPCEELVETSTYSGGVIAYSYNAAGKVQEKLFSIKGTTKQKTTFTYDSAGRLLSEDVEELTGERSLLQYRYSYDSLGRLSTENLWLTHVGCDKGPVMQYFSLQTSPIPWNEGIDICLYASGYTLSYLYDSAASRPKEVRNGDSLTVYQYDTRGSVAKEEVFGPKGTPPVMTSLRTTTYTNTYKRRKEIIDSGTSKKITYKNKLGQTTRVEDWHGKKLFSEESFTHDAKGRLASTDLKWGSVFFEKRSFRYECLP